MRKILNKGHRIRASDKHLVYHFSIGTLLFVFVAVLLLLNIKQLMFRWYLHETGRLNEYVFSQRWRQSKHGTQDIPQTVSVHATSG